MSVQPASLPELMCIQTARELASVIAAVGLAQNLAACRALVERTG